uniref:NADH-ubiquinone oxidoreductase chain 4 n=1 Tax=Anacestra spiniger TaxID=2813426 RepID=A0A8T9ZXN0_9HEMI|nr:NADH dehydrogenase subunit 4 [Anacestra spiniger]
MMKLFFLLFFMIPLVNHWWLMYLCYFFLCLYMMFLPISMYYIIISFGFGMDLISYNLIFLSIWITLLMVMASVKLKFYFINIKEFLFILLMLLLFLLLSFSTFNFFLYYLFFESSMIPILLLIFGWGYQPERLMAGFYLLFYTLFASFPLFLGLFYIFNTCNTMFYFLINLFLFSEYLYFCLIFAFLVKMPMVFLHFWLPKAHVEAPISGSMILAGVLLKLGGYGLYRVFLFLNGFSFNYFVIVVSLFGGVIVGFLCLNQIDMKSLIAYSSVAHMGLVIGGIMIYNNLGFWGSFYIMMGHGLCSSGLFVLSNMIYERSYSRSLLINKGLMVYMPGISMFWFLFCVNNMASPLSLNFLGEIFLINSIISWNLLCMIFFCLSSFLSCCYSIYLFSVTQHGQLNSSLKMGEMGNVREYLLLFFHWLPLNILFLKSDLLFM